MGLLNLNELDAKRINRKQTESEERKDIHVKRFIRSFRFEINKIDDLNGSVPAFDEIFFIYAYQSFSSFAFILYLLNKFNKINELVLSTFNMGNEVIDALIKEYKQGNIQQLYLLVNDKFSKTDKDSHKYEKLIIEAKKSENLKIKFYYNHSKVNCINANNQYFVIEGSGNSSRKSGLEQYVFLQSKEIYEFRANIIKSIINK